MHKKWTKTTLLSTCFFIFNTAIAGVYSEDTGQRVVATVSVGPAWYQAGKTQSIYLQPEFENAYIANTSSNTLVSGELFLGLQRPLFARAFGQLGFTVATTSPARLQGHVWELADENFDNFTYQYRIKNTRVAVKGKLLSEMFSSTYLPYLSGSLGVAFNRASQFSMTPLIFEVIPEAPFQAHTQTAFTYTLGAGLQKSFNHHWQIGIGYEFADWGNSALARSAVQTQNSGLTLSHLYTNQLQFSLSYLA